MKLWHANDAIIQYVMKACDLLSLCMKLTQFLFGSVEFLDEIYSLLDSLPLGLLLPLGYLI